MLCDKCLNRTICKYFAFFADAPMVINIESCEKAHIPKEQPLFKNPNDNVALLNFKQPIDYSQFDMTQEEEIDENEEKVFVDLSQQTEEKEISMMDLLLEGEDENGKSKKTKTTN